MFQQGSKSIIIVTLCALIMMSMMDLAVFDAHNHDHDHSHSYTEKMHEPLDIEDQQHANNHDLHEIYHSVASVFIQSAVDNFVLQNFDDGLKIARNGTVSLSISFKPPVPPPLV